MSQSYDRAMTHALLGIEPLIQLLVAALTAVGFLAGGVRRLLRHRRRTALSSGWAPGTGELRLVSLQLPTDQDGPVILRGRRALTGRLARVVHRPPPSVHVLVGPGGVGKSALAAAALRTAPAGWWVPASDQAGLLAGLAAVARACGAPAADVDAVRDGSPDGPDRLNQALRAYRGRWVLVLDNLDDVALLGAHRGRLPTGGRGLVLVTSRLRDRAEWGAAELIAVDPLPAAAGAELLLDLAPAAGDRPAARALAVRCGGLPLALRNAGKTLAADVSGWRRFADYTDALDRDPAGVLRTGHPPETERRLSDRTFQLTVDLLARHGRPDAGPLLGLLCCLAPNTPIPVAALPAGHRDAARALVAYGLAEPSDVDHLTVHPVIADLHRDAAARDEAVAVVVRMLGGAAVRVLVPHVRALLRSGPAGPALVDLTARLAEVLTDGRDERTAAEILAVARSRPLDPADPAALALRHSTGRVALQLGRPAEHLLRTVRDDRRHVLGPDHRDTVESARWHAWSLVRQERYDEGDVLLTDLHRAAVRRGPVDGQRLHLGCMLNWVRCKQGRMVEAERGYDEVVAGRTALLGAEHPDTLDARHSRAKVRYALEHLDPARRELDEVLGIRRRLLGPEHPDTLETEKYAALCSARARRRWVRRRLRRVLAVQAGTLGTDHPDTLDTVRLLAALDVPAAVGSPLPAPV